MSELQQYVDEICQERGWTKDSSAEKSRELSGLYYAISHGYNVTMDFLDDTDVASGALTTSDYYVLYVLGPNVSAPAQAAIATWIRIWGTHNRQVVLAPDAATADEYNSPTPKFDALAGVHAGSRVSTWLRATPSADVSATSDPYTATVQNTNTAFFFHGQTMNIRGPFQALAPLSGAAGPGSTDQQYTAGGTSGPPACMTREYPGLGVSNFVTTFGFFPWVPVPCLAE